MSRTSIDGRSNGRYRARYQGPDRRWRSRTFDRRIDAQRWLSNEPVKLDRGEWVDPRAGRVLFESVAERWMAGRVALRETTRARDRSYLNSLVLPHLGDKPVGGFQPSDLETWVAELMAAGKAPATIQKAWQIASGVFRLAVKDENFDQAYRECRRQVFSHSMGLLQRSVDVSCATKQKSMGCC